MSDGDLRHERTYSHTDKYYRQPADGPIQRRLDKRLKQQSARREQNQANFRALVKELAGDKALFANYLTI